MDSKSEQKKNLPEATPPVKYESIFAPGLEVNISEYITEILIRNFLNWQNQPLPKSAFWRKGISEKSPALDKLKKRFVAELTAVKELVQVFSPSVVARYFVDNKTIGIRMVKAETRKTVIEGLFKKQLEYNRRMWEHAASDLEKMEDKRIFTKVSGAFGTKNKMSKL